MQSERFNELADVLKSLAHPERIAIMKLICGSSEKRMTVKKIYETLGIEQPIVSRHLGILKRSGILRREMEGLSTYYCLCKNNEITEPIYKCLSSK